MRMLDRILGYTLHRLSCGARRKVRYIHYPLYVAPGDTITRLVDGSTFVHTESHIFKDAAELDDFIVGHFSGPSPE